MSAKPIPVFQPSVVNPIRAYNRLYGARKRRRLSNFGPEISRLEERLAEYVGLPPDQVVATTNATAALHGILETSRVEKWSVPGWSFVATYQAAKVAGKEIQLVDIDPSDWQQKNPQRAPGALITLPFGLGWKSVSHTLAEEIVVDAAASFGELEDALSKLQSNMAVVVSFHATKVVGFGEGGAAFFGNADRAIAFRGWTNFGLGPERIPVLSGYNAKMSEYCAAFLNAELARWGKTRIEWQRTRSLTDKLELPHGIAPQPGLIGAVTPYWNVVIEDPLQRERVCQALDKDEIGWRRWWPIGIDEVLEATDAAPRLPVTRRLSSSTLGLPFFRGLTRRQVDRIDAALHS